jgi:hypothetical protein
MEVYGASQTASNHITNSVMSEVIAIRQLSRGTVVLVAVNISPAHLFLKLNPHRAKIQPPQVDFDVKVFSLVECSLMPDQI